MPDTSTPNDLQSPTPIEPRNNLPGWVFAVFLLIIAAMAFMPIYRVLHLPARRALPSSQPVTSAPKVAPVQRPAPQQRLVPAQPPHLTDNDVDRILALPLQQQAEELLERSIRHDERARELMEKHLSNFKGLVRETPQMKNLLNRAQYSRDLRVRNDYCALMLAMDGWREDADAVQILIQRAQNDPGSRAYDVWFLGMLGGRGVKPDQVQQVLLNYARNDPDENVRLWATEGMRFLGSDQALDDLFDIFINDPSFKVRDRAGCNVSDCGNFMRRQRMRMFPKFLELAESPATNAQMRSWSFLAMQEITDVALPDAKSWRQWYAQHGEEKMAQFKSIPEWQVRGDE